jgi:uncharacterized membrane protein
MRSKFLWILLAASLLLNVFFAGGVIYSKMTAERLRDEPAARFDFVVDELGLGDAERARLMTLRESAFARRDQMRREGRHLREELFKEMAKPDFDEARVEELLRQRSALFVTFLGGVMADTHDFLANLDAERKREFMAMMQREHRFLWRLMRDPKRDQAARP